MGLFKDITEYIDEPSWVRRSRKEREAKERKEQERRRKERNDDKKER